MVSPKFLVPHLDPVVCIECGRPPAPILRVIGLAFHPVPGTSLVHVDIDFDCPNCQTGRRVTRTLTRSRLFGLLSQAIDNDRCSVTYTQPVDVNSPLRTRPSIRKGTPPAPISNADLEKARRLLDRTSYRRSTKGWKRFLKRLRSQS